MILWAKSGPLSISAVCETPPSLSRSPCSWSPCSWSWSPEVTVPQQLKGSFKNWSQMLSLSCLKLSKDGCSYAPHPHEAGPPHSDPAGHAAPAPTASPLGLVLCGDGSCQHLCLSPPQPSTCCLLQLSAQMSPLQLPGVDLLPPSLLVVAFFSNCAIVVEQSPPLDIIWLVCLDLLVPHLSVR